MLGSSSAPELSVEGIDFVPRFDRQHAQRRFRYSASDSREPGEPRGHSSAEGNRGKTTRHRLGSKQHALHRCQRTRQTHHGVQEIMVRQESTDRPRLYDELSVHGWLASRDLLHGNEGPRQIQLDRTSPRVPPPLGLRTPCWKRGEGSDASRRKLRGGDCGTYFCICTQVVPACTVVLACTIHPRLNRSSPTR